MKTLTLRKTLPGFIFAAGCVLTWSVYVFMTTLGHYYEILTILGALTLGVGIWVLNEFSWTRRAITAVLIGLLISQWWFLEYGLANVLWAIRGFAP